MEDIISEFTKLNNMKTGITLDAAPMGDEKKSIVITFNGSLNTDNSIQFSESLSRTVKCGYSRIIFNLKGLHYASSAGIGVLVTFLNETKSENIDLILCNVNDKIFTVMETLGFSSFFTIVPGLDDIT